jgi:hypothetical protein
MATNEYWLIAFDSTHHALRAESEMDAEGLENDIRPTPKSVTAGCALAIDFLSAEYESVKHLIESREIVIRGYFKPQGDAYIPL